MILVVLALVWTGYGIMVWWGRAERRNENSISSFSRHLSVLERTSPARAGFETVDARPAATIGAAEQGALVPSARGTLPGTPTTVTDAQIRRRNVLAGLAAASLAGVLVGGLLGGIFVWLAVASVVAFGTYVVLLARRQQLAAEQQVKVHYLPQQHGEDAVVYKGSYQPAYLRSAN